MGHPCLTSLSIFIASGSVLLAETIVLEFLYSSLILNMNFYGKLNCSSVFQRGLWALLSYDLRPLL